MLHPKENWHGFGNLEDGYCMLDPIKVSIVTPGVADKGGLDKTGIPATLVTGYLHYRGVEVEKTTDFTILVLFSIGITKGKWGTLLNGLLEFKRDYDANAPLEQVLPHLTSNHPATYGGMGLRDLADQMFAQLKESKQTQCMAEAFSTLPEPKLTPNNAYQYLVRDDIEHVPLEELADRVLATSVVPYPPGIPMLMPGEATGAGRRPVSRLPARAAELGQAIPGLRPRHARRREPRWNALRPVPEARLGEGVSQPGRKMSLAQATMLVAGNMIGTGIFLLPVNLAQVGSISIYGWLIATAGAAGARPGVRAARPGQPPAGRTLRLRARFPGSVRRLPDQLHLLVRQLGGQHRHCGRRGGLSGRVDPGHRCAARQHHGHRRDHLDTDLRQHPGTARGRRSSRPGPWRWR